MAKWIYERWDTKWDSTKFITNNGGSILLGRKIDVATLNLIEIDGLPSADFNIGDVGLQPIHESGYNSGLSVSIRYVYENRNGSLFHSHNPMTKAQLANCRVKNTLIESVIAEEGTYPDDGIHTDGFWYVKVKKAFPEIKVIDGTTLKTATSAYIVQGGMLKSVTDMYVVQDGQIKKAR